ncbi:Similar to Vipr1: Vasoactive intestinal polypeptide receptor 1 (Mus musculus), partial [Cotesia congregata]
MIMDNIDEFIENQKNFCHQLMEDHVKVNLTNHCPPFFDGLLCWPPSNSNQTINLPCPPLYVLGYENPHGNAVATKYCNIYGEWYRNNEGTWLPIIKTISIIGYASSFLTLIAAMTIFLFIRKLQNSRNRLHMNLFSSFIMRASMALLKDWLFVDGVGLSWNVVSIDGKSAYIKEKNIWVCKVITSLWQYSIVANYSWIFIEGLYLHNLIFFSFTDTSAITCYTVFGWSVPLAVVIIWIILRIIKEDTLCWTTHNNQSFFLIIRIPIIISIMLNFVLFINIVRVLLIKMKTSVYLQRKKMQYGKWAKSTLVLIPLFGAHYAIFLGLSYHRDYQLELIWLFWDQFFASFQGSVVALLYCFLNGEVRAELKRTWRIRRSRRGVDSLSFSNRNLIKSPELRNQHR